MGTIAGFNHIALMPSQLAVRANARVDERLIDDPATYQDFFTVLDKAIFLTRHNVD